MVKLIESQEEAERVRKRLEEELILDPVINSKGLTSLEIN
jgi:hypothetical protein